MSDIRLQSVLYKALSFIPSLRTYLALAALLFSVAPCFGNDAVAVQCSDVVANALKNFNSTGTSWMCCSSTAVDCVALKPESLCDDDHGSYAQCVSLGGVKACSMSEYGGITPDDGAPCGIYSGQSSPFKYSSLKGGGESSLSWSQDVVGQAVLDNWPTLGFENYLSLCCSLSDCRLVNVTTINHNACDSGEHMLKCSGDHQHGICSIWTGDQDSGRYFLLNSASFDIVPPGPSSNGTSPLPSSPPNSSDRHSTDFDTSSSSSSPSITASNPVSLTSSDLPLSPGPERSTTAASPSASLGSSPPYRTAFHLPVWTIATIASLAGLLVFSLAACIHARGYCGLRSRRLRARPYHVDDVLLPSTTSERALDIAPPQYSADDPLDQKRRVIPGSY